MINVFNEGKIKWSNHAVSRLQKRNITRKDVINCIMQGKIIEEYPDYWLNPACLVFGFALSGKIIHVVVGLDEYAHIITAYYPDNENFEDDMITRKEH